MDHSSSQSPRFPGFLERWRVPLIENRTLDASEIGVVVDDDNRQIEPGDSVWSYQQAIGGASFHLPLEKSFPLTSK